ncbi:hypothetical protein SEUCBS139899_009623 [Sporothrix eucalyptigena]|uniref:Cyanovirin-N domain-containing protein n=1 Tax=Sporothrix eucalyptigena TaxID=1812306 RepID=A0ABP0CEZ8_9PEZI
MIFIIAAGLAAVLLSAHSASARFASECRNICLDTTNPNILITECTIDGSTTDTQYEWAQFDLNEILAYSPPTFVYKQDGDFSPSCNQCAIDDIAAFTCKCGPDTPLLDLNTYLADVAGSLCFANNAFGPICGTSTSLRC